MQIPRDLSLFGIKTPKRGKEVGSHHELLRIFIFIFKVLLFIICRIPRSWTGTRLRDIVRPSRTKRGGIITKPKGILIFLGGFRQLLRASRIGDVHLVHDHTLISIVGLLLGVLLVTLVLEVTKEAVHPLNDLFKTMFLLHKGSSRRSRGSTSVSSGRGAARMLAQWLGASSNLATSCSAGGKR